MLFKLLITLGFVAVNAASASVPTLDTDHAGTPKAMYHHETGEEVWSTDHETYGKTRDTKAKYSHPVTGQPFEPNLRMAGQYEDFETGLYQNCYRFYDPDAGRYINQDPIGLMGGLNAYQYTPNPIGYVDPLGLSSKECSSNSGYTPLSSQARRYLADIEAQTGLGVTPEQRSHLANALREQEFLKLTPEQANAHRIQFNRAKNDLISQWEQNTGQSWPRYSEDVLAKNGVTFVRRAGQPYDAHHLIESGYGGPNEWWNMHPARFPDQHQGGIHRANGVAREIFSGNQ